jgi:hypothetical protein
VQRVEPAIVGLQVEVPRDRPSALTLGAERWGSGVIFDAAGHVLTVSYIVLDAQRIEATLRDGRKVPARLVALDLEVGVGVVKLEGPGPWPVAALGDSTKVAAGDIVGTVGVSDDGRLSTSAGRVDAVRPFSAAWEYMLDRAFVVSPYNPAFGGATLVDSAGAVIGVTSLRLGEAPYVNLAIPIEHFLPGKDELLAKGRVASRRPRPWLGLYTVSMEGGASSSPACRPSGPRAPPAFARRRDRAAQWREGGQSGSVLPKALAGRRRAGGAGGRPARSRLRGDHRAPHRPLPLLPARTMIRAHLLRWRPRQPAQRTESTPRRLPSGAASQLDPSHRASRVPPAGS